MSTIGQDRAPNTMLDSSILSDKVILCCGEDETAVREVLRVAGLRTPIRESDFRSYHVFKYEDVTVILSGIGTGTLEPLLFEIFSFDVVRTIFLVGTAGRTPQSSTKIGQPYIINQAYLAGTPLDKEMNEFPLSPNFNLDGHGLASIVSTDFYYGFSLSKSLNDYPSLLADLQKKVRIMVEKVDLVDMEVGQFYAFCKLMSPGGNLRYLAIKGPANNLGCGSEQIINTQEVLTKAFAKAFSMLEVIIRDSTDKRSALPEREDKSTTKLMEEVKLYWGIQIAVVSVFGYLATNINFSQPEKTFLIVLSAIMLVGIGAIYNLVGNYYTFHEGERAKICYQENVVTPSILVTYGVLSMALGLLLGHSFSKIMVKLSPYLHAWIKALLPYGIVFIIGVMVAGILFIIVRLVFKKLIATGTAGYRTYSWPLTMLLFVNASTSTDSHVEPSSSRKEVGQ